MSARTVLLCPVGIVVVCRNSRSDDSFELIVLYEYKRTDISAEQEASKGFVGFHAPRQGREISQSSIFVILEYLTALRQAQFRIEDRRHGRRRRI